MRLTVRTLPWLALLALPLLVAALDLGVLAAAALVALCLIAAWVLRLRGLAADRAPELVLETLRASHFSEKVRWSMDRLGVAYTEQSDVGTLGAFYAARTVPRLSVRTGAVRSTIGDSPAILRYLWGRYAAELPERAQFLRPHAAALDYERRVDRYGAWLQQWVYFHLLPNRNLTLGIWGARDPSMPVWQRLAVRVLYPLQRLLMRRTFRIGVSGYAHAVSRIEGFLAEVEDQLGDGRYALLGGEVTTFVDIAFAALSGIWVWPANYGGPAAAVVIPAFDQLPAPMRADIERWKQAYPRVTAHVEGLYAAQRLEHVASAGTDVHVEAAMSPIA